MKNGREYVTFPMVPLRELVYHYPEHETSEYLPAEAIAETVDQWNGTPIVPRHPPTRTQSAADPEVYMRESIGELHDVELIDGGEAIAGTVYVDVEKANAAGSEAAEIVDRLLEGETLPVSAGYATVGDEDRPGRHNGEQYDRVQGIPVPDHVAVFTPETANARCSIEQGCRANATTTDESAGPFATLLERLRAHSGSDSDSSDDEDQDGEDDRETIVPGPVGDYWVADELEDVDADEDAEDETRTNNADVDEDDSTMPDEPETETETESENKDDGTAMQEYVERFEDGEDPLEQLTELLAEVLEDENMDVDPRDVLEAIADAVAGQQQALAADADATTETNTNAMAAAAALEAEIASYPAGGRAGYEKRKKREELGLDILEDATRSNSTSTSASAGGCGCGCGGESRTRTNYTGVPGLFSRSYTPETPADDVDEYPAAGRDAWVRRNAEGANSNSSNSSRSQSIVEKRRERRNSNA